MGNFVLYAAVAVVMSLGIAALVRVFIMSLRRPSMSKRLQHRFAGERVLRQERQVNSYGRNALGMAELTKTGALTLTPEYLSYLISFANEEIHIPLHEIEEVTTPETRLMLLVFHKILRVAYRSDGEMDAQAFVVRDADAWRDDILTARAALHVEAGAPE